VEGELRGCIGELQPSRADLASEVAHFAVAAATSDPRFEPVRAAELDELTLEISVLDLPEPVSSRAELDPEEFGVVVSAGARRGVLLPEIAGVVTVDQQLRIALHKAGIDSDEPYAIERFRVRKVRD
jgi:AmmeMemoRadiSam system protein A